MILLSAHNLDEIEIHIKSEYGVNVTIKFHDKSQLIIKNVSVIHWLDTPTHTTLSKISQLGITLGENYWEVDNSTFYWLSFEPATKIEE